MINARLYERARRRRLAKKYLVRRLAVLIIVVIAALTLGFVSTVEYFVHG